MRRWGRKPDDNRSGAPDAADSAQPAADTGAEPPVDPAQSLPVEASAPDVVVPDPPVVPDAPDLVAADPPGVVGSPPVADPPAAVDPVASPGAVDPVADAGAEAAGVEAAGPARQRGAHRRAKPKKKQADETGEPTFRQKPPHKKAPWWELPALIALAIAIAILVKTFLIQPFYIPSASMEKTLHGSQALGHDRILVNKVIYDFRDPHPGDIIVFSAPSAGWNEIHSTAPSNPIVHGIRWFGQLVGVVPPDTEVLVKRVIATGGETVEGRSDAFGHAVVTVTDRHGRKHQLTEPYVWNDGPDTHATFGPVVVPKGRLWVMGDHRNDSQDSRYHCSPDGGDGDFGSTCNPFASTVPIDHVIGKAFVVAWPPSHWRTLGTPKTFDQLAAAVPAVVPSGVGLLSVLPVYFLRRRRRRR